MHDATSAQHEEESRGLLHQVFTILARKESDVTRLVLEVEDLILKDENLKSKPKGMILHWLSRLIIHPKSINRVRGRGDRVLRWLFSYMVVRHWSYSPAGSAACAACAHSCSLSLTLRPSSTPEMSSPPFIISRIMTHHHRYQEGQSF